MKVYIVLWVMFPNCDCCGYEYNTRVFADRDAAYKLEKKMV